jgi:TM2 domain-containing membrane protein YozV
MAEPLPDMDKLFMETVKGRYPLAAGPSTARFWTPKQTKIVVENPNADPNDPNPPPIEKDVDGQYVPRPDRSMVVLQALAIFGFLGIDHFYLRSTKTGIIKLLTLGGFGIWWLWDMLQVFTEKERVVNYGLTTPFDATLGIGQGMITDRSTEYSQNTSWFLWSLSTIFGFAGTTYLMLGRAYLGLRFLIITFLASGPVSLFITQTMQNGFGAAYAQVGFFGFLMSIFWMMLLLLGVGPVWLQHMYKALFDPADVMATGLPTPPVAIDAFRYWHRLYKDKENEVDPETETEYNTIRAHWDPTPEGIPAAELEKRFWIGYRERVRVDQSLPEVSFIPWLLVYRAFAIMGNKVWKMIAAAWNSIKSGAKMAKMVTPMGAASLAAEKAMEMAAAKQSGGARASAPSEPLSNEAKLIGIVLVTLLGGGAMKAFVDNVVAA